MPESRNVESAKEWHFEQQVTSDTFKMDLVAEHHVQGTYYLITNASEKKEEEEVTVKIDNRAPITVPMGASVGMEDIKFRRIEVSSGTFEVRLAGDKFEKSPKKGHRDIAQYGVVARG